MFGFLVKKNKQNLTKERILLLKELQKKLNIKVKDIELLDLALTHPSYQIKKNHFKSYERLEFLGDSILNTCIACYLYKNNITMNEGSLSLLRAAIVCEKTLSEIADLYEIHKYINLGKCEKLKDIRTKEKVNADVMESIIGFYFLENGFDKTYKFVVNLFKDKVEEKLKKGVEDYKSMLQRYSLSRYGRYPAYTVVKESGPEHNKIFDVSVKLDNFEEFGRGRSKKEAEQNAAKNLLDKINNKL